MQTDLNASIQTSRLELVPLQRKHAEELFPVLSDSSLYEYMQESPPASLGELRDRYSLLESRRSPDGEEFWLNWVVRELVAGAVVGYVQATVSSSRADIAWVVGMPWQGRGYATEAARAAIRLLSSNGICTVRAKIHPKHLASQRVAAKVGFSLTRELLEGEEVWTAMPQAAQPGY